MLPHYLSSFCLPKTLSVTFSSTTASKDKSENSVCPRWCFDKRVLHLTLVWEPVSPVDPLRHNQQGTAGSCLATKYGFEGFFLLGVWSFFEINKTCHKPFWSSLRSALRAEKLLLTTQEQGLWADTMCIDSISSGFISSGFTSSRDPNFTTATRI